MFVKSVVFDFFIIFNFFACQISLVKPDNGAGSITSVEVSSSIDSYQQTTARNQRNDGLKSKILSANTISGITEAGPSEEIIKSDKPWPAILQDHAESIPFVQSPQLADRFENTAAENQGNGTSGSNISSSITVLSITNRNRPSFAGITGGGPPQQIIKPGKPWPARPEDYAGFSSFIQNPQLINRFQDTMVRNQEDSTLGLNIPSVITISPVPNRPSFAGISGGGIPQKVIKPGKPWPARPGDYAGFSSFVQIPQLVDRFQDTTAKNHEESTSGSNIQSTTTILSVPNRPSFAGMTGGGISQQIIKPGEPWPARPDDYAGYNSSVQNPQLVDRFQDTTVKNQEESTSGSNIQSSTTILSVPNRPSFAGMTGGGIPQQIIKPGEPWPARPEDYAGFNSSVQNPQLIDKFQDTTDKNLEDSTSVLNISSTITISPVPNRPSYAGISGGGIPQKVIKPGKPWPARPGDYAGFSSFVQIPQLVDRFQDTTAKNHEESTSGSNIQSTTTILSVPNRPSFAGITGGGIPQQILKPWPARPEDYAGFNSSVQIPQLVDRFQDTTAKNHEESTSGSNIQSTTMILSVPNRPSFAGMTGGGISQQIIKPGKPWPARPDDYAGYNSSVQNPQLVDRFQDTTAKNHEESTSGSNIQSTTTILSVPNRPSFAGMTGGGIPQQIIKPGKPWPARPDDYAGYNSSVQNPQLVDRFQDTTAKNQEESTSGSNIQSTTTILSVPNRPSFAGITGGGIPQQIIKPWPARPEDYAGFNSSVQNPQLVDRFQDTVYRNQEDST